MFCESTVFRAFVLFLGMVCFLLGGCGKKEVEQDRGDSNNAVEQTPKAAEPSPSEPGPSASVAPAGDSPSTPAGLGGLAAQNAELLKQANQGKDVEPISVETLKGFLPTTLVGMDRGDVNSDALTVMGVKTTEAYADYAKVSGPGDMQLSITDVGNATGPIAMVMTGWMMGQINNQSDTEYEKTTTFQGCKALEEYNNEGPSGTFTVVVANRFVVEVSGSRVTMETLKKAMGQVDLKKLAEAVK